MMWRKRWYGLAAAWAICLIAWLAVTLIPNSYQSDARVYVRYNALLPTAMGLEKSGGGQLQQVDIVRRTLTSRPNLEKVLRRSDPDIGDVPPAQLDALIAGMVDKIQVTPQGAQNLYQLSYLSDSASRSDRENAAFSQRVVQNLIDIFTEENLTSDRDNLNQAIRFLDEQIAERETQLGEAEAKNAQFESKYFGQLPGEGDLATRVQQARTELARVSQELIQARSSFGALQSQLGSTPATINAPLYYSPSAPRSVNFGTGTRYDPTSARGRIEGLERQISDSIARGYTEKHPDVVNARATISRLQAEATKEKAGDSSGSGGSGPAPAQANPVYVNLRSLLFEKQSAVAALSARQQQLAGDMQELARKQVEAPGVATEQARLNRDYGVVKASYENLLKSREQIRLRADVATQTNQIQFQTIDPPTLPVKPVAPNRPLLLTLALLGGLAVGLAVAFAMSQLQPAYITQDKLAEDTGLPVIGSVGEVVQPAVMQRERRMLRNFAALGAGLVGIYVVMLAFQLLTGAAAA